MPKYATRFGEIDKSRSRVEKKWIEEERKEGTGEGERFNFNPVSGYEFSFSPVTRLMKRY